MIDMNKLKEYTISTVIVFPSWSIIWIPVSFLFEQNPIISTALLAPLLGFTSFHRVEGWQAPLFGEITFPWLVYWSLLIAAVIIFRRLRYGAAS